MKIMIIRHGDPDYSIDSLTQKGWREAELLAKRLKNAKIDDFYTSPLGRAKDTASLTLKEYQKDAKVLNWLREFDGKIKSPFTDKGRICWDLPPSLWCNEEKYYQNDSWYKTSLMSGGNVKEIYDETVTGIDNLLSSYGWNREGRVYRCGEDKTIALFCHFGMGITVLSYILGISPVVAQNNFFLAPTSVTTLVSETDKKGYSHFRAIGVGDISHLYKEDEPMSESGLYPDFYE